MKYTVLGYLVSLSVTFAAFVLVFSPTFSWASDIELVAPMRDFLIYEPQDPPGLEGVRTYSPTGVAPEWGVAQWNIPGGKLTPFISTNSSGKTIFEAHSAEASVKIARSPEGDNVNLAQDGSILPCLVDGHPRESDLLISPNGDSIHGGKLGMLYSASGEPKLAQMNGLTFDAVVSAEFGLPETNKNCVVNQAAVTVGIVLSNRSVALPQTMFYQLKLARFCGLGPAERVKICHGIPAGPQVFFSKNPFGTDDLLPLFDGQLLKSGETRTIHLDLLPRLKLVIETGALDIDRDLSHWFVNSIYLGTGIWGDVIARTAWRQFHLVASTK